jgi:hypothetical protein
LEEIESGEILKQDEECILKIHVEVLGNCDPDKLEHFKSVLAQHLKDYEDQFELVKISLCLLLGTCTLYQMLDPYLGTLPI